MTFAVPLGILKTTYIYTEVKQHTQHYMQKFVVYAAAISKRAAEEPPESLRRILHCALSLAAQRIVIGPVCGFVCVCGCVCVFVGLLPRYLEIACIDPHQTGFIGKGSDHLQLIKFWPSCTRGKGVSGGAEIFGYTTASAQCLRLSERFFH